MRPKLKDPVHFDKKLLFLLNRLISEQRCTTLIVGGISCIRGRQPFAHCGRVSAWHHFADRPSV